MVPMMAGQAAMEVRMPSTISAVTVSNRLSKIYLNCYAIDI